MAKFHQKSPMRVNFNDPIVVGIFALFTMCIDLSRPEYPSARNMIRSNEVDLPILVLFLLFSFFAYVSTFIA